MEAQTFAGPLLKRKEVKGENAVDEVEEGLLLRVADVARGNLVSQQSLLLWE